MSLRTGARIAGAIWVVAVIAMGVMLIANGDMGRSRVGLMLLFGLALPGLWAWRWGRGAPVPLPAPPSQRRTPPMSPDPSHVRGIDE